MSIASRHLSVSDEGAPQGVQDASGWGLLGLVAGVLAGFAVSFYLLVPLFPKDRSTLPLTLMTTLIVVAMTIGGVVGYLVTRRKQAARAP